MERNRRARRDTESAECIQDHGDVNRLLQERALHRGEIAEGSGDHAEHGKADPCNHALDGDAARTANLFLEKVLTSPATTSSYKLLESRESELEGYKYYQLEYEMNLKADMRGGGGRPPPKRHVVTTCVIGNEKLYLLTVGTVDRRWPKMGERLRKVANSLKLLY